MTDEGTEDVYLFRMPTLKLVGTLTGFTFPQGACSDKDGDVWITDMDADTIAEYSHTGEKKGTLHDSHGNPVGCAWDPMTGNLAVTELTGSASSIPAAIEIYTHAGGTPKQYSNPQQAHYNFAGFDMKGDLFVDGSNAGGTFMLSELPKGAMQAHTVQIIGGTIHFPGMVQWDAAGDYLAVGDQECGGVLKPCVYHVSIKHSSGSIIGKTKLNNYMGKDKLCDVVQPTLYGSQILGGDLEECGGSMRSTVYAWPYPNGGNPTAYNNTVVVEPFGAAVSK